MSLPAATALLALAVTAGAQDPSAEQGDLALAEGRYSDAIRLYRDAQELAAPDADLLAHLGDAYAAAGDVGRAVLSYEQALCLSARAGVVRARLESLRRREGLQSDVGRGWRDYHRYMTRSEWAGVGVAATGVLLVALVGRRALSRPAVMRLAATGLVIALPTAVAIARLALERDRAVVVAPESVVLRLGPDGQAEEAGSLRPGKVVWITRSFAGFVRVRTTQGAFGWIPRASAEPVTP